MNLKDAVLMSSVFRPGPGDTVLTNWQVFEIQLPGLDAPSVHLVGSADDGYGRVCSPVQAFDPGDVPSCRTRSRRYFLKGPPAQSLHPDADYILGVWLEATTLKNPREACHFLENDTALAQLAQRLPVTPDRTD